ncbi:MAG: potassium channel family protein [Thermodesulfobacteriota bacterium]
MSFTVSFMQLLTQAVLLLLPLLCFLCLAFIILGQLVGRFEGWSRADALYWSFITATTVGYGDISPQKNSSRFLAVVIAIVGFMFTGIFVAATVHTATVALGQHLQQNPALEKKAQPLKPYSLHTIDRPLQMV